MVQLLLYCRLVVLAEIERLLTVHCAGDATVQRHSVSGIARLQDKAHSGSEVTEQQSDEGRQEGEASGEGDTFKPGQWSPGKQ